MKKVEIAIYLHDELISTIDKGFGSLEQKGLTRNAADELSIRLNGLQMGPNAYEVAREDWKTVTCLAPWADWGTRLFKAAT